MTRMCRIFQRYLAITGSAALLVSLASVTPAVASTPDTATPGVATPSGVVNAALPSISPTPKSESALGQGFAVPPNATIVRGRFTDPATMAVVQSALRDAGVQRIDTSVVPVPSATGLIVDIGTAIENPGTTSSLTDLGVKDSQDLPAQGYVLAATARGHGGGRIVLQGVDDVGVFYAAQSLRDILANPPTPHWVPGLTVRDWPSFANRGGMQSFYGPMWTTGEQLRQLQFLAENKMNTYFYGVAGDVHTDQEWSVPYSATELESFRTVVAEADRLHIDYIYRISPEDPLDPGAGICHSSATDRQELIARLQQMWDVGVRSFTIAWDDVAGTFTCSADHQAYDQDPSPAASAQTAIVDFVQKQFIDTHPGANPLMTVPTEYWGDQSDTYRTQFDTLTGPDVRIFWTGPSVVSQAIGTADIQKAQKAFPTHHLLIWDNYPVNDFNANRLFLGPVQGRSADLDQYSSTIMFNEMQEEAPSEIPLSTAADYAWNPASYNPTQSWERAIRTIGGSAWRALGLFALHNSSSALGDIEPTTLATAITTFEDAYRTGKNVGRPASTLEAQFAALAALPSELHQGLQDPAMLTAIAPWLQKLGEQGEVGIDTLNELLSQADGDDSESWQQRLQALPDQSQLTDIPQYAASAGIFAGFAAFARVQNDGAIGTTWYRGFGAVTADPSAAGGTSAAAVADGNPGTAYTAARATQPGDGITVPFTDPHTLSRVVILQGSTPAAGTIQVLVNGTWQTIGTLHSAYTSVGGMNLRATAVRVQWRAGQPAPTVYEISPHYSDVPAAQITVSGSSRLVAIGRTTTIPVTVSAFAPSATSGQLAIQPPQGWLATPQTQAVAVVGRNRVMTATTSIQVGVPAQASISQYTLPVTFTIGAATTVESLTMTTGQVADQSYQNMVLGMDPAAYWPLNDATATVAHDLSGHGHDGTYEDGAAVGAAGPMSSTAANLAAGYVEVPRQDGVVPSGAFTIEAWVKLDAIAPAPGQAIVESYTPPAFSGFALRVDAGQLQGWTMSASASKVVTGPTTVTAGTWHYVAEVFDGSTLTIYLDGLPDGSVATTAAPGVGTASVKLGARGDDAVQRLDGDLAGVAIYPVALTSQQIATHYLTGISS